MNIIEFFEENAIGRLLITTENIQVSVKHTSDVDSKQSVDMKYKIKKFFQVNENEIKQDFSFLFNIYSKMNRLFTIFINIYCIFFLDFDYHLIFFSLKNFVHKKFQYLFRKKKNHVNYLIVPCGNMQIK